MSTKEYEEICSTYLIDKAKESSNNLIIGNSISTLNDGNHESEDSFNVLTIEPSKSTFNDGTSYINQDDLYIPHVATDFIPKKGQNMSSVNEGIEMYRNYAKAAGFGIRLGTTTKYSDQSLRKKQERKSYSKVTGCMAMIGFDRNAATNKITVYAFEEAHNHPLTEFNEENICSPNHRLSIFDQELIVKASTINIGATKAHKIRASLKGGYDNLPATKNDFKNFWRDYTNIVGPNDAQCVVDQYNMIFVPFTAINNHEKTFNVGAGLISDETIESYSWLLEAFLSSHKKKPTMILLDMDAALSSSIAKVFQGCTHRLCMWHIMSKMPSKDNKWLADMFNKREKWIPLYFRDIPLCGLMKTTSRSESSNSFFNVFSSPTNLLVNFMFNFDTALSKQRHEQKRLDIASRDTSPQLLFPNENLKIEKHASLDATSFYEKFIESVIHDKEKLQELVNSLQQLSETCGKDVSSRSSSITIKAVVENIIGVPISTDVKIKVPSGIKTKGSGKRNRIKSAAEKAIAKSLKPKRKFK
uniref:MULE transposase domain-containing protein n=1 Tax=Lactuca sativa TaxID=4236 RepID=A0A9R1UF65_LACSA|nr:hypothetical protein LSAT_V11C900470980 [Lactuca sativa]